MFPVTFNLYHLQNTCPYHTTNIIFYFESNIEPCYEIFISFLNFCFVFICPLLKARWSYTQKPIRISRLIIGWDVFLYVVWCLFYVTFFFLCFWLSNHPPPSVLSSHVQWPWKKKGWRSPHLVSCIQISLCSCFYN